MNLLSNILHFFHPDHNPRPEEPAKIIAFGNVLLDISVQIKNTEILDKYNLNLGQQGEINTSVLNAINDEIKTKKLKNIKYGCGGSALNTIRILKKIDNDIETVFFGSIGTDENGTTIERLLKENKVKAHLQKIPNSATGQCFCFTLGDKNALYANIGASQYVSKEFIISSEKIFRQDMKEIRIYYIEGFFLPLRLDIIKFIVREFINKMNILAVNLNSSYIVTENKDNIIKLLKNTTLIFGNKIEFDTLADLMNFVNLNQLADYFCTVTPIKKIIIVTSGKDDVIVFTNFESDQVIKNTFPVPQIPDAEIKDTTGAGDSFVAGFLASFVRNQSIRECIENGCTIASKVVKEVGCNIEIKTKKTTTT